MRRRDFIAGLGSAAAWPVAVQAQQRAVPVVGILGSTTAVARAPVVSAFMQGLKDTGFVEGQNMAIVAHWTNDQYDRLPTLVAELIRLRAAVIVVNRRSAHAAKAATTTVPIIFASGIDPVQAGLVAGLNRPGGNVTGVVWIDEELEGKRLAWISTERN